MGGSASYSHVALQAQTSPLLDRELDEVRARLELESGQKADLLREIAAICAWVLRQAEAGRKIEARDGDVGQPLIHAAVQRLHDAAARGTATRMGLSSDEAARLADLLSRPFVPTPALRATLSRLASSSAGHRVCGGRLEEDHAIFGRKSA
jgi:uncharacterized protein (DUF1778 family)